MTRLKKQSLIRQPLFLLLLLGFCWGSGYSLARFATTHGVSPLGYAWWQALGAFIFVGLLASLRPGALHFSRKMPLFYLVCGILGIALPNTNMYFASQHMPASLLAVIINIAPIITYLLALLTKHERFQFSRLLGVILVIAGISALFLPHSNLAIHDKWFWLPMSLISPLCFSLCALYIAWQQPKQSSAAGNAAGMLLVATLLLTPVVWHAHDFYRFHWPLQTVDWVILLEILLASLGYMLLFQLLKYATAVYYSLVSGVVAITGVFWGVLFFSERFSLFVWLAMATIVAGISCVSYVFNSQDKRKQARQ